MLLMMKWFILTIFIILHLNDTLVHVSAEDKKCICKTQACKKSAKNLKLCMKPELDPCDDFYEYACGNYNRNHPFLAGYNQMSPFLELQIKVLKKTAEILEKPKITDESYIIHNAKDFYASCIDTESMDRVGHVMIRTYLAALNLPSSFSFDLNFMKKFKWYSTAARFAELNNSFLFDVAVEKSINGSNKNAVFIKPERNIIDMFPMLSVGDEINTKYASEFSVYVKAIIEHLSPDSDTKSSNSQEQLDRDLKDLYEFSYRRQQIRNNALKKFVYEIVSLLELQTRTKSIVTEIKKKVPIVWSAFFSEVFATVTLMYGSIKRYPIVLTDWSYTSNMILLISNTNPKIIAMAMWLDGIRKFQNYTTKELRDINKKFERAMNGEGKPISRNLICANRVIQTMGMAITQLNLNSRKNKIVEKVRNESTWFFQAFQEKLSKANWMDESSRNAALTKLRNMKKFIGFPDELLNKNNTNATFEEVLYYRRDNYVANMMFFNRRRAVGALSNIAAPEANKAGFFASPILPKAMHVPTHNSISLTLAFLQQPFYDHGIQAMNFGSIGFILSHEIAHAFDLRGKDFDANGNLKLQWSSFTMGKFEELSKCFVQFYGSFLVTELNTKVNGELTREENMADSVGLSIALHAYDLYSKKPNNDVNLVLPGFEDYTPKKLITLAFATMFCQHLSAKAQREQMFGVHAPDRFRVLGVLVNSEEFAQIWGCQKGRMMNPVKAKCHVL